MTGKADDERNTELAFLRDWCITVARSMGGAGFPGALEMEERLIEKAYEAGNLKGLKLVARDKVEMMRLAPPEERERLNALLRSKFGREHGKIGRNDAKEIARILKRNRIMNEDEGRLLLVRANEIHTDESKRDELEAINRLLSVYEGGGSID